MFEKSIAYLELIENNKMPKKIYQKIFLKADRIENKKRND
jgi:hypothetical protein